jgi:hypothetical protein
MLVIELILVYGVLKGWILYSELVSESQKLDIEQNLPIIIHCGFRKTQNNFYISFFAV